MLLTAKVLLDCKLSFSCETTPGLVGSSFRSDPRQQTLATRTPRYTITSGSSSRAVQQHVASSWLIQSCGTTMCYLIYTVDAGILMHERCEQQVLWRFCCAELHYSTGDYTVSRTGGPMHRCTHERPMASCRYAHSGALSSAHIATGWAHYPLVQEPATAGAASCWLAAGAEGLAATVTSYSPSVSGCCLCGLLGLLLPGRLPAAAPSSAAPVTLLAVGMDAAARLLPPGRRSGGVGCAGDVTPNATCDAAACKHEHRSLT